MKVKENSQCFELVDEKDIKVDKLIEHHIKYKEIHGEDKTVFIPKREHMVLHKRLRSQGKCNIPYKELAKISAKAQMRTKKYLDKHPGRINVKEMMKNIDERVKERVLNIKTY